MSACVACGHVSACVACSHVFVGGHRAVGLVAVRLHRSMYLVTPSVDRNLECVLYQVALKNALTLTVFKDTRYGIYVT